MAKFGVCVLCMRLSCHATLFEVNLVAGPIALVVHWHASLFFSSHYVMCLVPCL